MFCFFSSGFSNGIRRYNSVLLCLFPTHSAQSSGAENGSALHCILCVCVAARGSVLAYVLVHVRSGCVRDMCDYVHVNHAVFSGMAQRHLLCLLVWCSLITFIRKISGFSS